MARVTPRAIRICGCELEVADAVVARTKDGSCREMLDGTDALQLHSIKRRSRRTADFPGVSVLSKPTPALSKCLKLKCRITSQAGRRGFESRLPLHLFNHLQPSPNQLLSHLSQFDAVGPDLKAWKSDQSAATASRFRATEESTYRSR